MRLNLCTGAESKSSLFLCIGILTMNVCADPQGSAPNDAIGEIKLRVPGMTESFSMVLCQGASVETEGALVEIPSMYVLSNEVTWDLYDIFVYKLDESEPGQVADAITRPSKPYVPPDRGFGHEGYPAIGMTQQAAIQFCNWLSQRSGLEVRLPTQAEWSYLALAGQSGDFCCGFDQDSIEVFGWSKESSNHSTHPVRELAPNSFGLYDMHGNAAEWVTSDSRKPLAYGGGYRDSASECTASSFQRQSSSWNQSDPQIPKSQWWLADCSWVGFRFVIESDGVDQQTLERLIHDEPQDD